MYDVRRIYEGKERKGGQLYCPETTKKGEFGTKFVINKCSAARLSAAERRLRAAGWLAQRCARGAQSGVMSDECRSDDNKNTI